VNTEQFNRYVDEAAKCPEIEKDDPSSVCRGVIKDEWATMLGWGKHNSKIVFVGANPRWTPEVARKHNRPEGMSRSAFARDFSATFNGTGVKHFDYHRKILAKLREKCSWAPNDLKEFAFYTEIALCPTSGTRGIREDCFDHCFKKNTAPFIKAGQFKIIVTIGEIAFWVCMRRFCDPAIKGEFGDYIGKEQYIFDLKAFILPCYHPAPARFWPKGQWESVTSDIADKILYLLK